MIWRPLFLKYRKYQRLKKKKQKFEIKNYFLKNGHYGIKALKSGFSCSWQLETIRRPISKQIKKKKDKKKRKAYIKIFPYKGLSKKPKGVRMGNGKGKIYHWIAPVTKGKIIVETKNISYTVLENIVSKLPIFCKIIKKII
jgi:large subunit ribosomal protein L16